MATIRDPYFLDGFIEVVRSLICEADTLASIMYEERECLREWLTPGFLNIFHNDVLFLTEKRIEMLLSIRATLEDQLKRIGNYSCLMLPLTDMCNIVDYLLRICSRRKDLLEPIPASSSHLHGIANEALSLYDTENDLFHHFSDCAKASIDIAQHELARETQT